MAKQFVLKRDPNASAVRRYSIDYEAQLNPQQWAVVTAGAGASLVIAGAGTGKTRTLIYRLAWLIENGYAPESIVLLTFTRRAAREMLQRAENLLDQRAALVRGGTFHSFCLSILQRYAGRLGYPQPFNILDRSDAEDVIEVIRAAHGFHKSTKRFPRKDTLYSLFSGMTNRSMPMEDLVAEAYPQFYGFLPQLRQLHEAFAQYKREHGLMDYDDLMQQTLTLFRQHPDVLGEVAGGIRYVLVDEYQDTNRLQAELVEAFAAVHHNVMAVGDDAQSIYRFRGADVQNIMTFPQRFSPAQVLKLEQNYRSTPNILAVANYVLQRAHHRYEKQLFTSRPEGDLPALIQAPDDSFETRFVCQMVLELREAGTPLHEMAVLFRNGRDSYHLEIELTQRGIPFVKYGGLKLNDTAHVKDVMAHLKVAENPKDVVAWHRILCLLEGVGPRTAQEVISWILASQEPYAFDVPHASRKYVAGLRKLAEVLQILRRENTPMAQQIEAIVQYYDAMIERLHPEDAQKRRQDLQHFAGIALNYQDREQFLHALALEPIELTALEALGRTRDETPLVLSTIHSAKGLEFSSVFMIQALDGILPSGYAVHETAAMDEELRLLYVALTRAKDRLFVSYPVLNNRRSYGDYFTRPSRFLDDIPQSLLEPWQLTEEPPASPPLLPSADF